MSLSERDFHQQIDALQQQVEDCFDASELDVDLENAGGVLTIRLPNTSQVILSRQPALNELWIAARSGGFHCRYDATQHRWVCPSTGEALGPLLTRVILEQSGATLDFPSL